MKLFDVSCTLPQDLAPYWVPSQFSQALIQSNASLVSKGFSLRLSYSHGSEAADPLNIAEMKLKDGSTLGNYILDTWERENNIVDNENRWATLQGLFLSQCICLLYTPSPQYSKRVIATRNPYLANALLGNPIVQFDAFLALISRNRGYYQSLMVANPAAKEAAEAAIKVMEKLERTVFAEPAKSVDAKTLDWLCTSFNCPDKDVIRTFLVSQRMLELNMSEAVKGGKLWYMKFKEEKDGRLAIVKGRGEGYAVSKDDVLQPYTFCVQQLDTLAAMLERGIIFVRFKRSNNYTRDMLASSNKAVLDKIYKTPAKTDPCARAFKYPTKGYVRTVDLCESIADGEVQRFITGCVISHLCYIEPDFNALENQLKMYGFDPSITTVNLSGVLPQFKMYLDKMSQNLPMLTALYEALSGEHIQFTSPVQAMEKITGYVDVRVHATSVYRRDLHNWMLKNPMWFPGYNGQPIDVNTSTVGIPKATSLGIANLDV